ncbi:MAG: hypothetical protein MJY93_01960 [Fibrobacter sp.]|nr:hypothetical protein [Fibrobacter sp.]
MKKFSLSLVILVALFSVFTFTACSDKEAEAEIGRLTQENALLQKNIESLQHTLDSLNAYGDSVKKSLQKLDMGR